MDLLNVYLLGGSAVLLAAVIAVRVASRAGIPGLLAFLLVGLALGEAGLGIRFDDAELTQLVGFAALAIILAEGGLTTRWHDIRPVAWLSVVLSTVGVLVSVAVVAVCAHFALGLDWRMAVLIGAVVSSTDAAAVFSVLRRLPLRRRLSATLEAESGFNDPPTVILVTVVASDAWESASVWEVGGLVVYELIAGALIGLVIGFAGQWLLNRVALPASGLYPVSAIAIPLLAFGTAGFLHASGFLAVYVGGLVLGNASLPHRNATLGFAEGVAWVAQIGLFVLLGLLASPGRLDDALVPALVVGLALLLIGRPLSVLLSASPFRLPWREQAFLSWAGLRGAVPIVLATIPAVAPLAGRARLFDVVFLLVLIFTLVQAPTLPFLARRLGVAAPDEARDVVVEAAPLDELRADLLAVAIPPRSRLAGVWVTDLRLPDGAVVTLLVRDGRSSVPDEHTRFRTGDQFLVVTTTADRRATERRLRAVSRSGALARWWGEHGGDVPTPRD
ncbi:potassium/proton antiporter [Cryptosporangium phraense]|uniref:Potassium/proton antiporter n=1 Tax=Cryptosporangium phraense TaxID=2593070 RepID=A0A545ALL2_9ACTN|nr:potassium/proton antiporter [Cryptosporangium phraense]TQS42218.1 potassium/proton antiporter [Cryptosporangium phraense]